MTRGCCDGGVRVHAAATARKRQERRGKKERGGRGAKGGGCMRRRRQEKGRRGGKGRSGGKGSIGGTRKTSFYSVFPSCPSRLSRPSCVLRLAYSITLKVDLNPKVDEPRRQDYRRRQPCVGGRVGIRRVIRGVRVCRVRVEQVEHVHRGTNRRRAILERLREPDVGLIDAVEIQQPGLNNADRRRHAREVPSQRQARGGVGERIE